MNSRLAKEFRPLLLPWCVAAFAGLGHLIALADPVFSRSDIAEFLIGLAGFAFIGGCLLLATLPLGSEFHQRTLHLLLAQPLERSRLWLDKLLVATIAVVALGAVHGAILASMGKLPSDVLLPSIGFLVVTVCSAAVHTQMARSVIGGMVFTGTWQFAATGVVSGLIYVCYKALGRDPEMDAWTLLAAYICAGAVYSGVSLWLGWRNFAEMEVSDAPPGRDLALPDWLTPKKWTTFLRCQLTGNFANLIRKEVCLQKPVFTIAAVFSACWLLTLLLLMLQPSRSEIFEGTLNGLTAVHMTIVVLLAGCVSLGEEKALGLAAWHLTLPISAFRQWLVKLLVAAATTVLIGLALPLFLSLITLFKAKVGLVALQTGEIVPSVIVLTVMLIVGTLSFWAATFTGSTVQAALTTIATCVGLSFSVSVGIWTVQQLGGLQTGLLKYLIVHFHFPPHLLYQPGDEWEMRIGPWWFIGPVFFVFILVLTQSIHHFRRAQTHEAVPLRQPSLLLFVTSVIVFWVADLKLSAHGSHWRLYDELNRAFESLRLKDSELPSSGQSRKVTLREFERTDQLSNSMKQWLKNVTIEVMGSYETRTGRLSHYYGRVYFPNGFLSHAVPIRPQTPLH